MIDPSFFYWLGFFDRLSVVVKFCFPLWFGVSGVFSLFYFIFSCEEEPSKSTKEVLKGFKEFAFFFFVLGIVFTLLYFFIPDKENMIGMGIAKSATPENIKELTNYIVETIKQLKE